jgi:hypothetical protein
MKVTLLFFFAIIVMAINPFHGNAQWYHSYGVNSINELSEAQCITAMGKTAKTNRLGKVLSIAGGLYTVGGIATFYASQNLLSTTSSNDPGLGLMMVLVAITGKVLIYIGGSMAAVGIPIWISSASRKVQINKAIEKFPAKVALSPVIIRDFNHYSLGLTATLRF